VHVSTKFPCAIFSRVKDTYTQSHTLTHFQPTSTHTRAPMVLRIPGARAAARRGCKSAGRSPNTQQRSACVTACTACRRRARRAPPPPARESCLPIRVVELSSARPTLDASAGLHQHITYTNALRRACMPRAPERETSVLIRTSRSHPLPPAAEGGWHVRRASSRRACEGCPRFE